VFISYDLITAAVVMRFHCSTCAVVNIADLYYIRYLSKPDVIVSQHACSFRASRNQHIVCRCSDAHTLLPYRRRDRILSDWNDFVPPWLQYLAPICLFGL